jgi:hypothetical protein
MIFERIRIIPLSDQGRVTGRAVPDFAGRQAVISLKVEASDHKGSFDERTGSQGYS